ncbi:hypothetical protein VNI00_009894 [Paramarasmius palmivorus]|uniref:F-box domain-containing protein n=1 Tax=Paramarasmius palmivorus TaxID=297713 RepID=A0AAW0CP76_9AGAR
MILSPSPFLSKLGTDFLPSPAEKLVIRQLISARQEKIRTIQDEIARLQAEQDELQSVIDDHLTLISPIRQVHTDVLREIFSQCLPQHQLPAPRALEAPLLFTEVCRLWRKVAIDTPELWTRVHFCLPHPKNPPITGKFRAFMHIWSAGVRTWLQRTGVMPLALAISGSSFANNFQWNMDYREDIVELEQFHMDIAQQLLVHASRWRILSLECPDRIREILTTPTEELPSLKELRSYPHPFEGLSMNAEIPSLGAVLRRAPSLHSLHLNEPFYHLPIRWDSLTEVVLYGPSDSLASRVQAISVSEATQVLSSSCLSLRHYTVSIYFDTMPSPVMISPIFLPNLQTFNVHVTTALGDFANEVPLTSLQQVFDSMTTPKLVHFGLGIACSQSAIDLDKFYFLDFLERSGCVLQSLALDCQATSAAVIGLLTGMPLLKQLRLRMSMSNPWGLVYEHDSSRFLEPIIDSLTPSATNVDVLCPNIEVLMCGKCPATCAESLLALAEARHMERSNAQRLKRLQAHFSRAIEDVEVSSQLEALRKRGMLVQWCSPPGGLRSFIREPPFHVYVHSAELWWPTPWGNVTSY